MNDASQIHVWQLPVVSNMGPLLLVAWDSLWGSRLVLERQHAIETTFPSSLLTHM
jgi:hypothetical protein